MKSAAAVTPDRARPSAWYWAVQIGGWTAVCMLNAATAFQSSRSGLGAVVGIYGWAALTGVLVSDQWRRLIDRRGLAGAGSVRWLALARGIVGFALVETLAMTVAYAVFRPLQSFTSSAWILPAVLNWIFVFLAWTIVYVSVVILRRSRRLEAEQLELQMHAKEAELRALQAQVNPHFFFNSLNSVRALIFESPEAAAQMIDELAGLMRYALLSGGTQTVTLAQEAEAVRAYLAIERIRFEERLRHEIDLADGTLEARLPPMAVQTLVENAVKYGVERNPRGAAIRVTARRADGGVRIEVANEGALAAFNGSTQVGLENARRRLALALGPGATLDLRERDGWVTAALFLPEHP